MVLSSSFSKFESNFSKNQVVMSYWTKVPLFGHFQNAKSPPSGSLHLPLLFLDQRLQIIISELMERSSFFFPITFVLACL